MPLSTLMKVIFYFKLDDPQKRIAQALNLNQSVVSAICHRLQGLCSVDGQNRPFTPFDGPGAVVKCDESKFIHKPKV